MTEIEPEDTQPKPDRDWPMLVVIIITLTAAFSSLGSLIFYIWTQDGRWGWTAALLGLITWLLAGVEDE